MNDQDMYSLLNEYCFNDILYFKNKNYQFAKNKNGDLIVQLTELTKNIELTNSKIFYGLKSDGRYFFSNESYVHKFNIDLGEDTKKNENNNFELSNSKILFVTIKNIDNKENEYLFSINSLNSMVELYDLNSNNYLIWNINEFFGFNKNDDLGPCKLEIFELKKEFSYEYIIAFIPNKYINENISDSIFIKIFRFKSFNINTYEELNSINFENFKNKKILSIFLIDDKENTLVVLTHEINSRRRNSKIMSTLDEPSLRNLKIYNKYYLVFYNDNFNEIAGMEINSTY